MKWPSTLLNVIKMRDCVWKSRGYRLGAFAFTFVRRRA